MFKSLFAGAVQSKRDRIARETEINEQLAGLLSVSLDCHVDTICAWFTICNLLDAQCPKSIQRLYPVVSTDLIDEAVNNVRRSALRHLILSEGRRLDGRLPRQLQDISCTVSQLCAALDTFGPAPYEHPQSSAFSVPG